MSRPRGRPRLSEIREEPVREEVRTQPREEVRIQRLQRRRGLSTDKFFVPEEYKKSGWSYEWKRNTYMGLEDREHQLGLAENHWRAVQSQEMPKMMPAGYSGAVERGGMILMCRPAYLTEEAREEVLDVSRQRVRTQEQRLGLTNQGELPRTAPVIKKEYGPVTAKDIGLTIPE